MQRGGAEEQSSEAHIKAVMRGMFDRPESPLDVGPVVAVGDHAIAGWTQGDMGGRALLRRRSHVWQIVLCSGDQIRSAEALAQIGLPPDAAKTLSARLADAERKIAPERLAQFSRFDGIVRMREEGHYPPPHGH